MILSSKCSNLSSKISLNISMREISNLIYIPLLIFSDMGFTDSGSNNSSKVVPELNSSCIFWFWTNFFLQASGIWVNYGGKGTMLLLIGIVQPIMKQLSFWWNLGIHGLSLPTIPSTFSLIASSLSLIASTCFFALSAPVKYILISTVMKK